MTPRLSESQIQRYARHILLPDVGGVGQGRLLAATVAVEVGASRPAAAVALAYLAAAGVGRLRLQGAVDDPVTAAEVSAGILYGVCDVGRPRGAVLARRLRALNPDVEVDTNPAEARHVLRAWTSGSDLGAALVEGGAAATNLVASIARATP
jgi:molybdopterin/thiamine biosynthesis adenylyltransferase